MENAAMAAYLKDVENNTRDMTAERIIKEKLTKPDNKDPTPNFNRMPDAAPETVPRYKSKNQQFPQEVDPCDPMHSRVGHSQPRVHQPSESRTQGRGKPGKGKGKGRKAHEDEKPSRPTRTLWYEALSPEGYTYYWHVETNESVWEPPEEGFMTIAEQEEEAKEQALQEELLEQLEKEKAIEEADIIEEQRANAEREKLKEVRKQYTQKSKDGVKVEVKKEEEEEEEEEATEEEERPYRRDYSLPVKSHPYGPWQTVEKVVTKPVDLQLPEHRQIQLPIFVKSEPPVPQRTFKEKTIGRLVDDDDDDDDCSKPTAFKRRKIGNKSVRKRLTDD